MHHRLAPALGILGSLTLAACGSGGSSPAAAPTPAASAAPAVRPNLVVVMTDDLDVPTYKQMPRLRTTLTEQGLTFSRSYVSQSLCAPSRVTLFTGQYSHSHGVVSNHLPNGGWPAFHKLEQSTLAVWLRAVGYRTSLVGKYLNDYPKNASDTYIPPGWDDWAAHVSAIEDGRYFNYWVNDNGHVTRYGSKPEDYSVDRDAARAVAFIHDSASRTEPLFLYVAPECPHTPADYAQRHQAEFKDAQAPRVPSFNESDVSQKPSWVRGAPPLDKAMIDDLDNYQRKRLRSMSAVVDMVNQLLVALGETGRLGNTYFFFTSDNGLLMGQHRITGLKQNPYEESIQVPLVVLGPGVPVSSVDAPVVNVDLTATLLDLAGATIPDTVEGRSLVPFLRGEAPPSWRSDVLIENYGLGLSLSLRTNDWMYNHQDTQEFELYDMHADPYQLHNLYRRTDPSISAAFDERVRTLHKCQGVGCR